MKFKTFLNIVNVTLDYCEYFNKGGVGAFIIDIIGKDLISHGNLLQPCPLRGHLYLRDFKVDLSHIPFFLPRGEYLVVLYMYQKRKEADIFGCSCLTHLEVKPK